MNGGYTDGPKAVHQILSLSELRPFTIQAFCPDESGSRFARDLRAANRILQDGRTRITASDIEAIKDSVLAEFILKEIRK